MAEFCPKQYSIYQLQKEDALCSLAEILCMLLCFIHIMGPYNIMCNTECEPTRADLGSCYWLTHASAGLH